MVFNMGKFLIILLLPLPPQNVMFFIRPHLDALRKVRTAHKHVAPF